MTFKCTLPANHLQQPNLKQCLLCSIPHPRPQNFHKSFLHANTSTLTTYGTDNLTRDRFSLLSQCPLYHHDHWPQLYNVLQHLHNVVLKIVTFLIMMITWRGTTLQKTNTHAVHAIHLLVLLLLLHRNLTSCLLVLKGLNMLSFPTYHYKYGWQWKLNTSLPTESNSWSFCYCYYRKISNTIRTLVKYAPQTFTGEPWENVSLAVQYAPVLCHSIQTCSLPYIVLLSEVSYSIVHFFHTY